MGIIARQSIKGTIVNYLGVFVGFLTTFFVLTRFLSAEEIGLARVLVDTGMLFMSLAQLGTASSIIRFFPYFKDANESHDSRRNANGFFFWTIAIPLLGFGIVTLLYLIFKTPLENYFIEKSPLFVDYYYAVIPMAFFMLYQTIFETNANVLMRIVVPKMVREVLLRLFLLADYLLYAFRIVNIDGFVCLLCICYGLAALCNIIYLYAYGHISFTPNFSYVKHDLAKKYIFYTLFQITAAIATVLTPTLSSYFITSQMGLEFTGIFAIATYIAAMVSIPYRSLNAIANPQLAQTTKDGNTQELTSLLKKVSNISLLSGILILTVIWINIDLIFHILPNGATYEPARYVVLILGLSQLLICAFNATTSVLNFSKFYYLSLVFSFILTIASLLLNYYLVPVYGINGGALANLLAYVLYYAILCITMKLACHISPFSIGQLKTCVIITLLIGICTGLDFLFPECNVWLASVIKTSMWFATLFAAYAWQISPDLNNTINQILRR